MIQRLVADRTSMVVDLQDGGAITSLQHDGHEWLVQGPDRPAPDATSSFIATPPRGWDEMFPTIVACEVAGQSFPDHGQAWRHGWMGTATYASVDTGHGWSLRRLIDLRSGSATLSYSLIVDRPMPFLWAAHPLVRAVEGSRVELGSWSRTVLEVTPDGVRETEWDDDLLTPSTLADGAWRKLVLPPDAHADEASVVHPDGRRLTMRWPSGHVPYLALYLENRAFSGEPLIAIEPMTGWYDSLRAAVDAGQVSRIEPGQESSWQVQLQLA